MIIFSALALTTLSGCDSDAFKSEPTYKLESAGGDIFLLNQETGELSIVAKDKLVKLEYFNPPSNKLFTISSDIENKVDIDIKTKLMGGKMAYALTIKPKSDLGTNYEPITNLNWFVDEIKKKPYEFNRINIDLMDSDGFELISKEIYLSNGFTRMIDNEDNASSIIYNGEFSVNPLQMTHLNAISFTYSMSVLDKMPLIKKAPKTPQQLTPKQ